MALNTAYQICSEPKWKCKTLSSFYKSVRCDQTRSRRSMLWFWGCFPFPLGQDPPATRRSSPTAPRRSSPAASRPSSPPASRRSSPPASRRPSPPASRRSSPPAPRRSSPPATRDRPPKCREHHLTRRVTRCCEYICENVGNPNNGTAEIFERL